MYKKNNNIMEYKKNNNVVGFFVGIFDYRLVI